MDVYNDLTLNIDYGKIYQFTTEVMQRHDYVFKLLFETFDKDEAINDSTTNRIIALSAALVVLNMFNNYVNSEQLEAKRKELNDELEGLQEVRDKLKPNQRKGGSDEDQRVFNLLKQL